jgi:hypothetical protein
MKLPASIRIIVRGTVVEAGVDVDLTGVIVGEALGELVVKPPSASCVSLAHALRSSADVDMPVSSNTSLREIAVLVFILLLMIIRTTNDYLLEDHQFNT